MYSEQFNAPSWLEEPARWLWWAMQSRINGNLEDARYNLTQFWQELDKLKASANEATWPEIMAIDAQSHIQAANITSATINQMEQDYNDKAYLIPGTTPPRTAIEAQQNQRLAELRKTEELANAARTATATRAAAVAQGRISQDAAERAQENTQVDRISRESSPFSDVPTWAWIAGAALIAYLVIRR